MSLFNKLLKKKQELEKELTKSKDESSADAKEEVSENDTVSDIDNDEIKPDTVLETDETDSDEYEEDDEELDEEAEFTEEEVIEKVTNILMDNGFYSSPDDDDEQTSSADPNVRYLQEKLRNLHIDKTLFIAPVTKKGDDLSNLPVDHVIHISFNAAKMIESDDKPENMDILVDIPAGYSLPDETEPVTEMHLRTIVNENDNNSKWLPVFLSYQDFINMFGNTFRMQLVTFEEVYRFINEVDGIVIEPGALNLLLKPKKTEQSEEYAENQADAESQSDEKDTTIFID